MVAERGVNSKLWLACCITGGAASCRVIREQSPASKESRKNFAVLRIDTLSPPSTSTPMAISASIHLNKDHIVKLPFLLCPLKFEHAGREGLDNHQGLALGWMDE